MFCGLQFLDVAMVGASTVLTFRNRCANRHADVTDFASRIWLPWLLRSFQGFDADICEDSVSS